MDEVRSSVGDVGRFTFELDTRAAGEFIGGVADRLGIGRTTIGLEPIARRLPEGLVFDLDDDVTRDALSAWFEREARTELVQDDVGELLYGRLQERLDAGGDLVLGRSPRSLGLRLQQTDDLRADFLTDVLPTLPADYQLQFAAARPRLPDGGLGWPVTSGGQPWEVDHVEELWLGGADGGANLLALPPQLHQIKTDVLGNFRRELRDLPAE
jgi:hypothetical protein